MSKTHRRNSSGEIDIFDAALYFSDATETTQTRWNTETSLEHCNAPMRTKPSQQQQKIVKRVKDKKNKQPSSLGGKLAQLLSSLFQQAASKKKSKLSTNSQSLKYGELQEKHTNRRSSISYCEKLSSIGLNSKFSGNPREVLHDKSHLKAHEHDCIAEKTNSFGSYSKNIIHCSPATKHVAWPLEEEYDGAESDASSDLFELKIYDFETTSGTWCKSISSARSA